MGLIQMSLIDI